MRTLLVFILFVAVLMPDVAYSECIMRSSSVTKVAGKIDDISDSRYMASATFNNERKCSISTRVLYKGKWETVFGEYTGNPEIGDQELCLNAVEIGVRQFLASKEAKLLQSDEQMVCSDEPEIKNKSVKIGEVIRLSEVTPHPSHKIPFTYKGVECRWFIETDVGTLDLHQWQGIICKAGRSGADDWTVVDKF